MSDETRCPVCDELNACGIAAGASECWCFTTAIPSEVKARIPAEAKDRRCVCQACATAADRPAPPPPTQARD